MTSNQEWEIIKLLFQSVRKSRALYTGNALKQLLKNQIFNLKESFSNNPINSNRWSAYCHYSMSVAFSNLLDKHMIDKHSTVVVHPLIQYDLMEELKQRGCKLIVTDIDLNSLSIQEKQLNIALKSNPELIIHVTQNGLYDEVSKLIKISNELKIPTLTVIDNELPTTELLSLFENISFGSVLWNFGDSFMNDQLNEVLDISLKKSDWYVSWFVENRTHSSLEYHLSSSQDNYLPLLENYLYLLLQKYKPTGLKEKIYPMIYSFLATQKISSLSSAKSQLASSYLDVHQSAVPDIIFDIEFLNPKGSRPQSLREIEDLEDYLHKQNKFFFEKIKTYDDITLLSEDIHRIYMIATFYTQNISMWSKLMQSNGYICYQYKVHKDISNLHHDNVITLQNQGLMIDFNKMLFKK
jgi:hypothetical protein